MQKGWSGGRTSTNAVQVIDTHRARPSELRPYQAIIEILGYGS